MINKTIRFEDIEREVERLFKSDCKLVIIAFDIKFVEEFDKVVRQVVNKYDK